MAEWTVAPLSDVLGGSQASFVARVTQPFPGDTTHVIEEEVDVQDLTDLLSRLQ